MRSNLELVRLSLFIAVCSLARALPAQAAHHEPPADDGLANVYAPYAFLIGEWEVKTKDATQPSAVTRFAWGRGGSYMLFSTSLVVNGREEPHFEGMLMWNGVAKHLDMLITLDVREGRAQEQGRMYKQADGVVVREITAYYSEGFRMHGADRPVGPAGERAVFRQTFKAVNAATIETSLMRKTPQGWVPTFPGSDKAVMSRRSRAPLAH